MEQAKRQLSTKASESVAKRLKTQQSVSFAEMTRTRILRAETLRPNSEFVKEGRGYASFKGLGAFEVRGLPAFLFCRQCRQC